MFYIKHGNRYLAKIEHVHGQQCPVWSTTGRLEFSSYDEAQTVKNSFPNNLTMQFAVIVEE
jgi:hypothetical protein